MRACVRVRQQMCAYGPPLTTQSTPPAGVDTSEPNAVVVGLAPDRFNYQTLNQAFR